MGFLGVEALVEVVALEHLRDGVAGGELHGEGRLMGFGHRVYKSYDPRAKVIKRIADLVFNVTGKNPLLDIALELERIALEDEYFVTRKLYPNVDFYSGPHLSGDGLPGGHVPGPLRHPAHLRLDRAVGGDAARPGSEDRPAAPDLHRTGTRDYMPRESARRKPADSVSSARVLWRSRYKPSARRRDVRLGDRAWEHLRQLVAIGPRPAGSAAIEQTRNTSRSSWRPGTHRRRAGVGRQTRSTGSHGQPHRHDSRRPQGAHRDRRTLRHEADREFRFVGASDGGSSAAFLLELARVLRARKNPLTIELLFLDGEEAVRTEWDVKSTDSFGETRVDRSAGTMPKSSAVAVARRS